MVYRIMDPDFCNSKYREILKIGFEYSEYFGLSTIKYIHKKDHPNAYFSFLKSLELFEVPIYGFETPRYQSGEKIHLYAVNKASKQLIYNTLSFDVWNGYDYPADLVFYYKKRPWFRCISHERIILINTINQKSVDKLKLLGLSFLKVDDTNYI